MGPACWDVPTLTSLIDAGMNTARMNFSHGDHKGHGECLARVREAAALRPDRNIGILLDTKGPEIRTGFFKPECNGKIHLKAGGTLELVTDYSFKGDESTLACTYEKLPTSVSPGSTILIADGSLVLKVKECKSKSVVCEIMNTQSIGERKNMNLPNVKVDLPVLQAKDIDDLKNFAVPQKVDFIAASFVQSADDLRFIRKTLGEAGKNIKIISKIENQEGLDKFDEILAETDGVMVARGDLGMEIPPEKVFREQKMMITKCRNAGKPCIVATQMLESMISNPRPTRAECSDVANAVLDGADCVMLSGETANGSFPQGAVEIMARTCIEAESMIAMNDPSGYDEIFKLMKFAKAGGHVLSQIESAASSAVKTACDIGAKAIIVLSESGETARLLSKFHPTATILSVCLDDRVARQVEGYMQNAYSVCTTVPRGQGAHVRVGFEAGKKKGLFANGDAVVCVHTMRNLENTKEWTVRILNVTSTEQVS
uniref:Pyruvate kinase n=1 Tax=Haptolina brevifila TaxID=156173 RepID=A0A7S2HAX6_9EUKA